MKKLIALALLSTAVGMAHAEDILIRDGAACSLPEGFNVAPFDPLYNPNGMSDFCVFPFVPLKEALQKKLDGITTLPDLPECAGSQLSVSPGGGPEVFPCYEVKESADD